MIPCKPTDLFSFLSPLFEELKVLESAGITVECEDGRIDVKAHIILASGDIPAVAALIHHSGHSSLYGCRQCTIKSISSLSPTGKGSGRYYTGLQNLNEERTIENFRIGDPVSFMLL